MQTHQGDRETNWREKNGRKVGWSASRPKYDAEKKKQHKERVRQAGRLRQRLGLAGFSDRKKRFVDGYIQTLNPQQAAIEAGYSAATAKSKAYQLLAEPLVKKEIDKRMAKISKKVDIDAAYVLRQMVKIHERSMDLKPVIQNGKHIRDASGNPMFTFDAANAIRSLELVGKHKSVQAFQDAIDLTGATAQPVYERLQQFIFLSLKDIPPAGEKVLTDAIPLEQATIQDRKTDK